MEKLWVLYRRLYLYCIVRFLNMVSQLEYIKKVIQKIKFLEPWSNEKITSNNHLHIHVLQTRLVGSSTCQSRDFVRRKNYTFSNCIVGNSTPMARMKLLRTTWLPHQHNKMPENKKFAISWHFKLFWTRFLLSFRFKSCMFLTKRNA